MKNKIVISVIIFIGLVIGSVLLTSCYEGFTASDGDALKKYVNPEALKELVAQPEEGIWLIDVRPTSAYKQGHIPTAKSFPSGEIMNRLAELPKEQYLILYCETGGRAQAVLKKLSETGYTRLMNWGGYTRWPWALEQ
jgi:rhodanese-related sulfurtransferase